MTPPAAALVAQNAASNGDPTAALRGAGASDARAKKASQEFEAVFLNQMFQHMFTGIDGEGPFGGGPGVGIWRSFLTDQYAKTFAKAGGIGLASHVYRSLIAHQEARAAAAH